MKDGLLVPLSRLQMSFDFIEDVLENDVNHWLRALTACVDLI